MSQAVGSARHAASSVRAGTAKAFFQQCRHETPRHVQKRATSSALTCTKLVVAEKTFLRRFLSTSHEAAFGHSQARSFHSTPTTHATVVTQNPRTDEEGGEMTIEISSRAVKRLGQITKAAASQADKSSPLKTSQHSHLRVTVTSGGCHGFQYLMSLEPAEKVDAEEDTIFAAEEGAGAGKAEVVMDSASLELLKGSTIDFTTELIGSQFKIVGNPRAKSSCGCGTSFDIE